MTARQFTLTYGKVFLTWSKTHDLSRLIRIIIVPVLITSLELERYDSSKPSRSQIFA